MNKAETIIVAAATIALGLVLICSALGVGAMVAALG